jgi:hypothetical protein
MKELLDDLYKLGSIGLGISPFFKKKEKGIGFSHIFIV